MFENMSGNPIHVAKYKERMIDRSELPNVRGRFDPRVAYQYKLVMRSQHLLIIVIVKPMSVPLEFLHDFSYRNISGSLRE